VASFLTKLTKRTVTVPAATVAAMVCLQAVLTLACVLLLNHASVLDGLVEVYRQRAAPLVGREVRPMIGVDRTGAEADRTTARC
jgi:hypothetical protein